MEDLGEYQLQNFGTETNNYQRKVLRELVTANNKDEAKKYILKYFVKLSNGEFLFYEPSTDSKTIVNLKTLTSTHLPASIMHIDGKNKWQIQKWFLEDDDPLFSFVMKLNKPLLFEKNGGYHINMFPGFKWNTEKNYKDFSDNIKKGVETIWQHIKHIWCSDNEQLFKYVQTWLCHVISGKKMDTILYLKSIQGTGKSSITEFIQEHVIGRDLSESTTNPNIISPSEWNEDLKGKILLIFEEINHETKWEWKKFSNDLKAIATGKTICIKGKYVKNVTVDNTLSVIINTNKNALNIENSDRRIVPLDISVDKVGDVKYFDDLTKYTNKKVGEAFYWFAKEHYNKTKDFKPRILPETQSKKDAIVENLPVVYEYLKNEYVLKSKGINSQFRDIYSDFTEWCSNEKRTPISKIKFSQSLKEIQCPVITKGQNKAYVIVEKQKLLSIYQKKKWIHELDEFFDDEIEVEGEKSKSNNNDKIIKFFD
jgi:Fe-S-cluster formation regulator IscX/YfhJ